MKIALINPALENFITGNNPDVVVKERGVTPPLGLLYIAASARKHGFKEIDIIDCEAENIPHTSLTKVISQKGYDIVGVHTTTFTLIDANIVFKNVKKLNSSIITVMGGPHAHIYYRESLLNPYIDFVVYGEGEYTFPEFLKSVLKKSSFESVKGLAYKENGKIRVNPPVPLISNLDELPVPAFDLINVKNYTSVLAEKNPVLSIFTSRGCPFNCSFCHRVHFGKKFRAHSPERVLKEMEICARLCAREIFIYDDTFTIDKNRAFEICRLKRKKLPDIPFSIRSRVNTVSKELLKALKAANCVRIHYGVESGSPRILKLLKKGITPEMAQDVIKYTRRIGIMTLAYFMIGNPTETKDEIIETIKFAVKLDPDYANFAITTPFPGTEIYEKAIRAGIFKYDFIKEFAENPQKGFKMKYFETNITEKELQSLLKYAYKKFYFRSSYILKSLFRIRSFESLKNSINTALNLLINL